MSTIGIPDKISIPAWVVDLGSFRRWACSDEFPEAGGISFLDGEIWADLEMEQLFSHNRVKTEIGFRLSGLLHETGTGQYVSDRMLLTNDAANLSTEPDGLYFHWSTVKSGQLNLIEGPDKGCVELQGAPDMVLEIVSRTTVRKDTVVLRDLYWSAGILEYWLIDARGPEPSFEILLHGPAGYEAAEATDAGVFSKVFGRSFRLGQKTDPLGNPEFILTYTA